MFRGIKIQLQLNYTAIPHFALAGSRRKCKFELVQPLHAFVPITLLAFFVSKIRMETVSCTLNVSAAYSHFWIAESCILSFLLPVRERPELFGVNVVDSAVDKYNSHFSLPNRSIGMSDAGFAISVNAVILRRMVFVVTVTFSSVLVTGYRRWRLLFSAKRQLIASRLIQINFREKFSRFKVTPFGNLSGCG
jgi:hypothetical protein